MPGPTTNFQTGVHGSRPAASSGCSLYWCTTHALMYRSDGSAWSTFQDLSVISAAGAYSAWTPALTATSVNPTLGSGSSAAGRYLQTGKHVVAQGAVQFGAGGGAAAGTGSYNLSLPVNARTPVTLDGNLIGHGYIFDSSTSTIRQIMLVYSAAGTVGIRMYDGTVVTNAAPWTWAASDALIVNYSYEAA